MLFSKTIKLGVFLIVAVSFMVCFAGASSALAAASGVYLTGIAGAGDVQVFRADTMQWQKAVENMKLVEGDRIKTGSDSGASIRYDDGAIIDITKGADLVLTQLRDPSDSSKKLNKLSLETGLMHGLFEKIPAGEESRFEIKSPTAVCGVLGTKIYIDADTGTVFVLEGTLTMVNLTTGESFTVESGSSVTVNVDGSTSGVQAVSEAQVQEITETFEVIEIDVLGYTPPADPTEPGAVVEFTVEAEEVASKI
jgi:hypothetical protein